MNFLPRFDGKIEGDLHEDFTLIHLSSENMDEIEESLTGEETYEEGIDGFIKSDSQDDQEVEGTIEYLDLDMIQEVEEYQTASSVNSSKKRKRSKNNSPPQPSILKNALKSNYKTQGELTLRPKYRPIRPKPLQSPTKLNKLQSLPPIVNFNPAGFIVTTQTTPSVIRKDDKGQEAFLSTPTKGMNYSKVTNGVNVIGKLSPGNMCTLPTKSHSRNGKVQTRTPKSSVELFFESMAKTVLNLPIHIQAEIKMEICKVVTMAEIKYLSEIQSKNS